MKLQECFTDYCREWQVYCLLYLYPFTSSFTVMFSLKRQSGIPLPAIPYILRCESYTTISFSAPPPSPQAIFIPWKFPYPRYSKPHKNKDKMSIKQRQKDKLFWKDKHTIRHANKETARWKDEKKEKIRGPTKRRTDKPIHKES